jgi:hypothetical protein
MDRNKLHHDDQGPLRVACYVENNHIVMAFGKQVKWLSVHPEQARFIAATLEKYADKLDSGALNRPSTLDEIAVKAQDLFSAVGTYLSAQSAVGIADTNEVLGMSMQALVDNAREFAKLNDDRRKDHRKGTDDGKPQAD